MQKIETTITIVNNFELFNLCRRDTQMSATLMLLFSERRKSDAPDYLTDSTISPWLVLCRSVGVVSFKSAFFTNALQMVRSSSYVVGAFLVLWGVISCRRASE